jgi:hypothetical protein
MRALKQYLLFAVAAVTTLGPLTDNAFAASDRVMVFRTPAANLVVSEPTQGAGGGTSPTQPSASAKISASPMALAFESLKLNTTSTAQTVTLSNTGNAAGTLDAPSITGPFTVSSTTCGSALAAGANCSIEVSFNPVTAGNAAGALTLPASSGALTVTLAGTGMPQGIVMNGSTRTWLDGTLAASCNAYLNGDGVSGHTYTGATGDGVYRLQLSVPTDVFCDMTKDGGGWSLVMNAVSPQIAGWTGNTGSLNVAALAGQSTTAKIADADIKALTVKGLRLSSTNYGGVTRYLKPSCRYGQSTGYYGTPCGTTYSNLSWADAITSDDNRGLTFGAGDAMLHAGWYFDTNDVRGYAWFVANGAGDYGAGNGGFQTPTSFKMWAK